MNKREIRWVICMAVAFISLIILLTEITNTRERQAKSSSKEIIKIQTGTPTNSVKS